MRTALVSLAVAAAAFASQAQTPAVTAEGAWARASVQGQSGTGAFMKLTAREPMRLVGASTPVAGSAEVHEMKMEGDVMRMRPIAGLDLPAGKPVELKPGGHHLMFLDLKAPLKAGTSVPVTLLLRDTKGQPHKVELSVPVLVAPPGGAGHGTHKH
jgi:copper(I)-binding protein